MQHSGRTPEIAGIPKWTNTEFDTKQTGSQYMSSPIIRHFFVSLFAVVHAAEYAPISWHGAQGAFIHPGHMRAMHHDDVSSGKVVVLCFVGQEDLLPSCGWCCFTTLVGVVVARLNPPL